MLFNRVCYALDIMHRLRLAGHRKRKEKTFDKRKVKSLVGHNWTNIRPPKNFLWCMATGGIAGPVFAKTFCIAGCSPMRKQESTILAHKK